MKSFTPENASIRILRSSEEEVQSLQEYRLDVKYPGHWFSPISLSPFAHSIEAETISWMQKLDLIKKKQRLAHVLAMEPRHYAGYSHSMAPYDHALMYCKYITMWLLWDDERVELAKTLEEVKDPLIALRGEQVGQRFVGDPYVRAFRHIGDEYERLGASRRWRWRFADRMLEWATYAIQEEAMRRNGATSAEQSFEEAIKLRAITVGIRPTSIPLERAIGIELPDEFVNSQEYELMLECVARVCYIINDIVGVPKGITKNQKKSNLVISYMLRSGTSLLDSYNAVLKIHDEAIETYDKLTNDILQTACPSKREKLGFFFDNLRYMDTGFGIWHQDCVRYQDKIAMQGNQFYRIRIGLN